jgi:hypothetical protein
MMSRPVNLKPQVMLFSAQPAKLRLKRGDAGVVLPGRAQPSKLAPDLGGFCLDGCLAVYQCAARRLCLTLIVGLAFGA